MLLPVESIHLVGVNTRTAPSAHDTSFPFADSIASHWLKTAFTFLTRCLFNSVWLVTLWWVNHVMLIVHYSGLHIFYCRVVLNTWGSETKFHTAWTWQLMWKLAEREVKWRYVSLKGKSFSLKSPNEATRFRYQGYCVCQQRSWLMNI